MTSSRDEGPAAPLQHERLSLAAARLPRRAAAFVADAVVCSLVVLAAAFLVAALPRALASVATSLAGAAYFVVSWWRFEATPGQRLLGLRVCSDADGSTLGLAAASVRWAALGGPLWIAYTTVPGLAGLAFAGAAATWIIALSLSIARSPVARGVHDRMSGSLVTPAGAAHVR